MANPEHVEFLLQCQGDKISEWNEWRIANPKIIPNLSRANLSGSNLREADLGGARLVHTNLKGADLTQAYLQRAKMRKSNLAHAKLTRARLAGAELRGSDLTQAELRGASLRHAELLAAKLTQADLSNTDLVNANLAHANLENANLEGARLVVAYLWETNLRGANLTQTLSFRARLHNANLSEANLTQAEFPEADLERANLEGANLEGTNLEKANLERANLTGANLTGTNLRYASLLRTNLKASHWDHTSVYGVSAWEINLDGATQRDLIITLPKEPVITVDNLKVAQFIYLLLNNPEIRDVIDTITSKAVLILGRFTPERKAVLETLRTELRKHNYSPILFDFEKPSSRDLTETVRTLAHLSRFIIADLTEPSSIPQELQAIVPDLRVPVQPVLLESKREYAMFVDFKKYAWVLPTVLYQDVDHLLQILPDNVIQPAETLAREYSK